MPSRKGCSPYSMTNRGLSIELDAVQFAIDIYLVSLDCGIPNEDSNIPKLYPMGMFLKRLRVDNQYARVQIEGKTFHNVTGIVWDSYATKMLGLQPAKRTKFIILQQVTGANIPNLKDTINGFRIASSDLLLYGSWGEPLFTVQAFKWDPEKCIMFMEERRPGLGCTLSLRQRNHIIKVIKLGFDFDFNPFFLIATSSPSFAVRKTRLDGMEIFALTEGAQFPALDELCPIGLAHWREATTSFSGSGNFHEPKQRPGLWAVRGDRVGGLQVRIGASNDLQVEIREYEKRSVWTVKWLSMNGQITDRLA